MSRALVLGEMLVIASLAAATAGCNTIKSKELEADLGKRVADMGLQATSVSCPSGVEATPRQVFTCQIAIAAPAEARKQAKTYALDVTIQAVANGKASFDTAWHDGPAVQTAKMEGLLATELGKALGGAVTLACGDEPLRFLDSQHKLRCELAAGEVKTKATIDFDARTLSPTDWHLDPPLLAKAKLEAVLAPAVREKAPGVTIDCGAAPFLARPADGVVTCKASDGAQTGALKVDIDDNLNVKRWELAPG
ncbi:MAG TPA: hypothetical protein VFP84_00925 [Kofleriaceae bacterium]|nr:hypothetical protein [Kofleriaceae bacterium]